MIVTGFKKVSTGWHKPREKLIQLNTRAHSSFTEREFSQNDKKLFFLCQNIPFHITIKIQSNAEC